MKTENNDMLQALAGLDERWIEEADPYAGPKSDGGVKRAEGASVIRATRLRMAAGFAVAAIVLVAVIVLAKQGLPGFLIKKPSDQRPGGGGTTATPTQALTTPTPEPVTGTPTPYIPEGTPTPEPVTGTPTPYIPEGTPTPTLSPTPYTPDGTPTPTLSPTPDIGTIVPDSWAEHGFLPRDWHSLSLAEVKSREYYRYLSPELFTTYRYNITTQSNKQGHYEVISFTRDLNDSIWENDSNIILVIVREKEDVTNYEGRRVNAQDLDAYAIIDNEDPILQQDPEVFYSMKCSPIFRYEEFTDEVLKHRLVHHEEDGETYDQIWFGVEAGDYVFEYLFRGTLTDETATLFIPGVGEDQLQPEELSVPYDDRQY